MPRRSAPGWRSCSLAAAAALALLALGAPAAQAAGGLQARVMVLPSEGAAPADARLAADVNEALMRGARRATPNVARATATLDDTAVIVGCDPADRACLDAVAAALNVDQMLLAELRGEGAGTIVEVTAVSREARPVSRRFQVRTATRKQDLAAIEAAVPAMLDAEGKGNEGTPPDGEPPPDPPDPGGGAGAENGANPGGNGRPSGFARRAPKIITIGGGTMAAIGLVFWGLAAAKQGAIDDAPTATDEDFEHLQELEDSGRSHATTGNVLVFAGGVTAGVGALWWWRSRRHRDATVITPVVGPTGAAVMLGGRW